MIAAARGLQAAAAALVLAGCAATPPGSAPASPASDRLSGRLAVRIAATDTQASSAWSAIFDLSGTPDAGVLLLATPLGTQLADVRWSPKGVRWRTPDAAGTDRTLDDTAQRLLGQRLPLGALAAWLRGQPWDGAPHAPAPGGFEQLGWRVDAARVADGRITAVRADPPRIEVRAILDAAD